jgi:hypothetical protein
VAEIVLKFALGLADLTAGWRHEQGRWQIGQSWIEAVANPALETWSVTDGVRTFLSVRERLRGRSATDRASGSAALGPTEYQQVVAEARTWPLEFFNVEATPGRGYTFEAGQWGTAPVYITADTTAVSGSWDIADLRHAMSARTLSTAAVARRLTLRDPYSPATLFRSIKRLTERATASFDADGLRLRLPPPAARHGARQLSEDADVVPAYGEILKAAMGRWSAGPRGATVEVSGGLDSAMVLLAALAALGPADRVATYGLLIAGPATRQQRDRRAALLRDVLDRDVTLSACDWAPFHPSGRRARGEPYSPDDEPYSEALEAILARVAGKDGRRLVFTGIGGDELMLVRAAERAAPAPKRGSRPDPFGVITPLGHEAAEASAAGAVPATVIAKSALHAIACRAPVFLRAGWWAVSPLCTPELIRFCQWLPPCWRSNKRLHRAVLDQARYGHNVVEPVLRENFVFVMQHGLRRYALDLLGPVGDSILVGLGLVDPAALTMLAQTGRTASPAALSCVYEIVNLEHGLRSLLG